MDLGRVALSLPVGGLSARAQVELAQRAEAEWGYDAIWTAETNGPDSLALAGALCQATHRSAIGTAIVPVQNRSPALLAMAATTLGELSEGRFVLGVGASSHNIIEGWSGIPYRRPLTHVREAVTVIRQALSGQKTDFAGELLQSHGFRLERGGAGIRVPVYVAALRERMIELAGEVGEGLIVNLFPVAMLPRILAAYRRGAARAGRAAQRDEIVCRFMVSITDDVAAARDRMRAAFGGYVATPVYNRFFAWCGFAEQARAVAEAFARRDRRAVYAALDDAMIDQIGVFGSAAQCRERVAAYVAAGVTTSVLAPFSPEPKDAEAVFAAFAPARGS